MHQISQFEFQINQIISTRSKTKSDSNHSLKVRKCYFKEKEYDLFKQKYVINEQYNAQDTLRMVCCDQ